MSFLKDAKTREADASGEVLTVALKPKQADGKRPPARATIKGADGNVLKVVAVCEDSQGQYVLARERKRNKAVADGKRAEGNGEESYLKRTAMLADYADAADAGLL